MSKYVRLSEDEVKYILDNANKKSIREMSEWIGCTVGAVAYQLNKHNVKVRQFSHWNDYKLGKLVELRNNGMKMRDIAEKMGVTTASVCGQFRLMRKRNVI